MASVTMPPSFCERRRNSRTLPPLIMPDISVTFGPDYDDVAEEGKLLFNKFILYRMEQENLEHIADEAHLSAGVDVVNPLWAKAGRDLRLMADEFARTSRRREIKQKAETIGVDQISYEEFKDLLSELFSQGHITKERIMVLFFFCADIAVRTVTSSVEMCKRFLNWSLSFITQSVCHWVRDHGGWEDVLLVNNIPAIPRPVIVLGACFVVYFAIKYYRS